MGDPQPLLKWSDRSTTASGISFATAYAAGISFILEVRPPGATGCFQWLATYRGMVICGGDVAHHDIAVAQRAAEVGIVTMLAMASGELGHALNCETRVTVAAKAAAEGDRFTVRGFPGEAVSAEHEQNLGWIIPLDPKNP